MDALQLRRTGLRLVLACSLALPAFGLYSCRTADSTITGVDLSLTTSNDGRDKGHHPGKCFKECRKRFHGAVKDEARRYRNDLRRCGDDAQCRADARARHRRNLVEIRGQAQECRDGCYNEGGGKGGR